MNRVDHAFGVGETVAVKLVATPRIFLPVEPVDDDVVDGDVATAKFGESREHLFLGVVLFAALPVAHHPFGHDGGFAGESAVTLDDIVHVVAIYKVIVDLRLHFAPPAHLHLLLVAAWRVGAQTAVGYGAVGLPLDLDGHTLSGLEIDAEFVGIGVPGSAPALGDYFLAVDGYGDVARVVEYELVFARLGGFDVAFIFHMAARVVEILREIDHMLELLAYEMLEVDGVLALHYLRSVGPLGSVGACQRAFLAILVINLEHLAELAVGLGVAEAAQRIAVPEDAVVVGRHHEGHRHLGIILEKFFVASLVVEFVALMLTESVDALLVAQRFEYLAHGVAFGVLDLYGRKFASAVGFRHYQPAILVVKFDVARGEADGGPHFGGDDRDSRVGLLDGKLCFILLRHYHKAAVVGKFLVGSGRYADDFVAKHLQTHFADTILRRRGEIDSNPVVVLTVLAFGAAGHDHGQSRAQQGSREMSKFHGVSFYDADALEDSPQMFSFTKLRN